MTPKEQWDDEFSLIGNQLSLWNLNVIPWMEQRGDEYKRYAHAWAKRLGWRYSKEKHAYEDSPVISAEDWITVMQEAANREIKRWLRRDARKIAQHGKEINSPLQILQTRVKHVLAFWEITATDDTGMLVIWDFRQERMIQHVWNGVPDSLYRRLFAPDGRKALNDILAIYNGQEIDPITCMELLHRLEQDLDQTG